MRDTIRRLRLQARLASRGKAPTAVRYTAEFRSEAVAVARRLRFQGVSMIQIARDLGVRPRTLELWLRRRQRPQMRPVVVTTTPATGAPAICAVLVTSQGHRVEGLDLDSLVRVLRSIS